MSIGGRVVHVEPEGRYGVTTIYTIEPHHPNDTPTCVDCRGGEKVKPGDSVWWQSGKVYWTPEPNPHDRARDFPLEKVGYSYRRPVPAGKP